MDQMKVWRLVVMKTVALPSLHAGMGCVDRMSPDRMGLVQGIVETIVVWIIVGQDGHARK